MHNLNILAQDQIFKNTDMRTKKPSTRNLVVYSPFQFET